MENNQTKPVTQTEEKTEVAVTESAEKTEKVEEKTFTQEEVNAMVLKATEKVNKKYKDIDLEAYKKWQDDQKTETEKQSEFNQKLTDTTNENITLKQENLVLKSGVNADDVDYVVFKVSKMDGEFEDNLKEFLKENPKYLQKEVTLPVEDTGLPVTKINENAENGVTAILKQKHPDLFNK